MSGDHNCKFREIVAEGEFDDDDLMVKQPRSIILRSEKG